jgi:hypothetical protein
MTLFFLQWVNSMIKRHNWLIDCQNDSKVWKYLSCFFLLIDNNSEESWICGPIPGVHATIGFGIDVNVTDAFAKPRAHSEAGPLVNKD